MGSVDPSPRRPSEQAGIDRQDDALRHFQIPSWWTARPRFVLPKYPPISSVPRTPAARLSEPDAAPSPFPSEPILAGSFGQNAAVAPETVLYLAYGSNMSAETFLGTRGIRPLSQINVVAPALELVFDLPGLPYHEPCFANAVLRKPPGTRPEFPPGLPREDDAADSPGRSSARPSPVWDKGLYGVVYEVTRDDYAKIVATEGGGAGYDDILVPDGEEDGKERSARCPRRPGWLSRLLAPVRRPDGGYAQPSARYLKLLVDGAREHDLPHDYQAYLGALQPYARTTRRQEWGRAFFLGFWAPLLLLVMIAGRRLADERGRSPAWVAAAAAVIMNLVWMSYDCVGKRVFGDGERTVEPKGEDRVLLAGSGTEWRWRRKKSLVNELRGKIEASDEEKTPFLGAYQ
ncbi:hypothetical protein VTH06DRAFT_8235 [Thermothelomyces fergusii]